MEPTTPAQNAPTDRFSQYDAKLVTPFKDCYIATINAEKDPIRKNMLMVFACFMAGLAALAWFEAPTIAYVIAALMTTFIILAALYLHFENRKDKTQPGHGSGGQRNS